MRIRADLTEAVVVDSTTLDWVPSPQPGVVRRMLERDGEEVARATSIVRYAPGARFRFHEHGGGEEILVLEGTFNDEQGSYGVGTYLRNPPGSGHAPYTAAGCTLLVKLRQMQAGDDRRVVVDTVRETWPSCALGVHSLLVYELGDESVTMEHWVPRTEGVSVCDGAEEVYIVDGTLDLDGTRHGVGTWLRSPEPQLSRARTVTGCMLWVKRGHF